MAVFLALFLVWMIFLPDPSGASYDLEWVAISAQGLERYAVVLFKTLAVVTFALILLATTPMHTTLKAAQALRLPGVLVQIMLMTLRYTFLLAEEFVRLRTALRVRGYRNRADLHSWRTVGHVAGTLLVRGTERAERVGQAMRCRGFDGTFHSLYDFRTRWTDFLGWAGLIVTAGAIVAWDVWRR
jgi:cobalt/nickel transport system permease protein